MYPFKTSPHESPNAPRRLGRAARLAALIFCALVLVAGGLGLGGRAQAQEMLRVLAATEDYTFAEALRFNLHVQSATPIVGVILFYGVADEPLVRRIYPAFTPGVDVQVTHRERIEPGQFAPGTPLRVWWRIETQDGKTHKTDVRLLHYNDTNQAWRTLQGEQVDLYWYGRDENRARDLLSKAEAALDRLRTEMGASIAKRIRIYVYNSQRDMQPALSPRSEGYDDQVTTLGVAIGEDALLLLGSHRDADSTLAHELSHIVVGVATDNPYSDLPRWLDEGLAMYAEGELPVSNQRALDAAIKDDTLLSIRSMTSYSGRASEVDLFYGEAYSIVDWMLHTKGKDKMHELLTVFREGVRQEDALRRVYGLGLDELDNAWRASLGLGPRVPRASAALRRAAWRGAVYA